MRPVAVSSTLHLCSRNEEIFLISVSVVDLKVFDCAFACLLACWLLYVCLPAAAAFVFACLGLHVPARACLPAMLAMFFCFCFRVCVFIPLLLVFALLLELGGQ